MVIQNILVVDDNFDICRSIKAHMQNESTEIYCVASASDALNSFSKRDYCLVILSNKLPGISGEEFLKIIRQTHHIPVLLRSDLLSSNDKVTLLQAGADAIIEDPFNIDICAAQAEALIQLYSATSTDDSQKGRIVIGTDLIITPRSRQVLFHGESLPLTRREFDLLHYFVHHPYEVISRGKLYSNIWGGSFAASSDETVRVHIQRLRQKLGAKGKQYIYTIRGVGYKFAPPNE